jgi:CubicO group peptidase (beta-lactamase class C family)
MLALLCVCFLGPNGIHALGSSIDRKVETLLEHELKNSSSPGMTAAVVRNGKLVFADGFGLADVQNSVPASKDNVYRLGSITKQFTSMMIMQLVQEGKLRLDAPAKEIIPDQIPDAWSEVTIRELLNHTAGVPNYTLGLVLASKLRLPVSHGRILDVVRNKPLDFKPGTNWSYSNSNYILLGLIIEKLDDRPYGKSLHARILDPLGMNATYFVSEAALVPHRACGYTHQAKSLMHATYMDMSWPFSAGSIESTVGDLAKWDAALYGDRLLKPDLRDQMWVATILADGSHRPYGFGWGVESANDIPVYEHAGGIPGFSTAIRRAPSLGLTTIVLMNSDDAQAVPVADHLMQLIEPRLSPLVKPIADPDTAATGSVRRAFDGIIAGKPDRSMFSDEMNKVLSPQFVAEVASEARSWGALKSFDLVKSQDSNGVRLRVYHVLFERASVTARFTLDGNGLIIGAELHPG